MNIALDELLNNIISYSSLADGDQVIDIRFDYPDERLEIEIRDGGKPFNPFDQTRPDTCRWRSETSAAWECTILSLAKSEEDALSAF